MAFPITATTTTTSLTNTIKSYYDRLLLEMLKPSTKFMQFGIKKPLPKGEGMSVIWNRPNRLALGFTLVEGLPVSTANALSTTKISAMIQQYGGVTSISDVVDATSITDVQTMATQILAQQAAETLERVIVSECFVGASAVTNGLPHHMYKTSAAVYEIWESVSGVSVCSNGTAPGGALAGGTYNNPISVSDVRKAIFSLKKLNVAPYDGNDYVAVINTESAEDLVGDSTWINFHQYNSGNENLYTGEIGKIYGCRFVETNLGPAVRGIGDSLSTTSAILYGTIIMGKGFYGVTDLDGGIKTYLTTGADKADPLNQTTLYGWKANFAAHLLNTSCGLVFWAGSGDTTIIGDESAQAGVLRYKHPTSY
jgi:N4-gp56 family major capsid protein